MHIIFLQNRQRSNQNRPKNYQIFFRTINFNFTHVQNSDNTIHPDLQATKILTNKIFLPEQTEGNFFFLAKNHKAQLHCLFRRCDVHKKIYKREVFFNQYINLKTAIAKNKFYEVDIFLTCFNFRDVIFVKKT